MSAFCEMSRVVASALVAAAVCGCLAVSGQAQDAGVDTARDWSAWLKMADAHAPGVADAAVRAAATWSRDDLRDAIGDLPRGGAIDLVRAVRRGLVLHTDVAMAFHNPAGGYDVLSNGSQMPVLADGREVGSATRTFHWEIGRLLIGRLPSGPDRVETARVWYRATSALLQQWGEYPELRLQIAAAHDELGDDPVLLLYEGTTHQAYAGPLVQRALESMARRGQPDLLGAAAAGLGASRYAVQHPYDGPGRPQSPGDERKRAEWLFRRALSVDPDLTEARVRLAQVLGDGGSHDEALRELRRVDPQAQPAWLDYYASLLLGREEAAAGDPSAARQAFERARAAYPAAQAPVMGLSSLALLGGDVVEAEAIVDRLPDETGGDPWLTIDRMHVPTAEASIQQMRARWR